MKGVSLRRALELWRRPGTTRVILVGLFVCHLVTMLVVAVVCSLDDLYAPKMLDAWALYAVHMATAALGLYVVYCQHRAWATVYLLLHLACFVESATFSWLSYVVLSKRRDSCDHGWHPETTCPAAAMYSRSSARLIIPFLFYFVELRPVVTFLRYMYRGPMFRHNWWKQKQQPQQCSDR